MRTQRYSAGTWKRFRAILVAYNRRGELHRLIRWASEKRLSGPLRLYQMRLADTERVLLNYLMEAPRLAIWARSVHILGRLLFPAPRYLAKGSAACYRYRNSRKSQNPTLIGV